MAYSYDVKPNSYDSHQQNAWWFAAVVRFATRDTFNRDFKTPGSKGGSLDNPVAEDEMLIIDNDCVNWRVGASMGAHVSNLNMALLHSGTDYVAEVGSDEWILFWVFDSKAAYEETKERVLEVKRLARAGVAGAQGVNDFYSGLKFVGRVDAVRCKKSRDPRSGNITIVYSLTANGFSEFDSLIYYNEAVTKSYANVLHFMADFGVAINDFVLNGRTHPQTAIPGLLSVMLGAGPGEATKGFAPEAVAGLEVNADLKEAAKSQSLIASPNRSYLIPNTVAALLGRTSPARPSVGFTYLDVLNQIIGIQTYDSRGWMPVLGPDSRGQLYFTDRPLDGDSLPYPLDFNKKTVWSILGTYSNAPINEMYTCLRAGPDGILPTFVCRQLPLSSYEFLDAGNVGTAFLDLPRWRIHDDMIQDLDIGRSAAAKFNYVYLTGQQNLGGSELQNKALGHAINPMITDDADIMRSGLRMYDATVSGTIINTTYDVKSNPGRRWSYMMSDILFGGHLKYSGTAVLHGVQAPICEGDNAVIADVLYRIERVEHSGGIDASGTRSFMTTLNLTNGISIYSETVGFQVYPDMRGTTHTPIHGLNVDADGNPEEISRVSEERRGRRQEDPHLHYTSESEDDDS